MKNQIIQIKSERTLWVLLFFIFLFVFNKPLSFGQTLAEDSMDFIVLPYIQDITGSSFCVMWETSVPLKGEIRLAKAEYHILKPDLKTAVSEAAPVNYHKLEIKGLIPDELYFYQVVNINGRGDTLFGPVTSVTIPDYNRSAVSFTVVGDNQGNIEGWRHITGLMFQECPQFVIHCGDLVQYGPNKDDWVDEFFKPAHNLLSRIPLYPAIGNHEMNNEKYYQYFNRPYNNAFYSIKKGNARIIFADTNKDLLPGSEQYSKLEQLLASSRETWKIVVHHHPVYTSGESAYRSSMMATPAKGDPNILHLKSLYEAYGVDLVLNGHVHSYERSWPIYKNQIEEEKGVVHIITGGGGGGFRRGGTGYKNWFTAENKLCYHFLSIQIMDNKLFYKAIDSSGIVFDTWQKVKDPEQVRLNTPLIKVPAKYFINSSQITIENTNNEGNINFRLNDEGFQSVPLKQASLTLDNTTTITAMASSVNNSSNEAIKTVVRLPVMSRQKSEAKKVTADYYEGFFTLLPDFGKLKPNRTFLLDSFSLSLIQPRVQDHFAVRFKGSIFIHETDVYRFFLESFDGSRLIIDGKVIIDNDGVHYEIFKEGYAALEKGPHDIEIQYFDFVRRETLNLRIGKQDEEMIDINDFINRKIKN